MSKAFLTTLLVSLVLFALGCDPGTSCPKGQVLAGDSNSCVENTCINYACDSNQHCVVSAQYGPDCECNEGTVGHHDYSGVHPVLVCEAPENNCSCTGMNTHCDSMGDCVCNEEFYGTMDYSGMHPVLNCENPCLGHRCPERQMCQVEEENDSYIPVCDYE